MGTPQKNKPVEFALMWIPIMSMWDFVGLLLIPLITFVFLVVILLTVGRPTFVALCAPTFLLTILAMVIFFFRKFDPSSRNATMLFVLPLVIGTFLSEIFRNSRVMIVTGALAFAIVLFVWFCFFRQPPKYWSALSQLRKGNRGEALALAHQAVASRPNNHDAYRLRSLANYFATNFHEAEQDALMALRLSPNNYSNLCQLGAMQSMLGKYSEAKESFTKALFLAPAYPVSFMNLGLAEFRLGNYSAASKLLLTATKAGLPTMAIQLYYTYLLGRVSELNGDKTIAEQSYRKMKRFSRGIIKLQEALQDKPELPEILMQREEIADLRKRLGDV